MNGFFRKFLLLSIQRLTQKNIKILKISVDKCFLSCYTKDAIRKGNKKTSKGRLPVRPQEDGRPFEMTKRGCGGSQVHKRKE